MFLRFVFPYFSILDARTEHFWPQIRILRKISSLEPAGNVPNPDSRSENPEINFLKLFFINPIIGLFIGLHRAL